MVALSRKTDYALIALVHLARSNEGLSSAREIASQYRVPVSVLMNIMKTLSRVGIVESVRGSRGGYRLALDSREVTLRMLISAIDGPIRFVHCNEDETGRQGECDLVCGCPTRQANSVIHRKLGEFLEKVTLADLSAESGCAPATVSGRLVEVSL